MLLKPLSNYSKMFVHFWLYLGPTSKNLIVKILCFLKMSVPFPILTNHVTAEEFITLNKM